MPRVEYTCNMFKQLLLTLLFSLPVYVFAQLQNLSFETIDTTGRLSFWQVKQGKLSKFSVVNFGALPFTAFQGNYFALLESDTFSSPLKKGIIEQSSAFTDTPQSIILRNLYIPENTAQHAELTLLLSKQNGTTRDTILFMRDTLPIVANGNTIPIQWNTFSKTLSPFYRSKQLPDSAFISITNDNTQTGKTIRCYIDALSFGKWPVGLQEVSALSFRLFPNPATNKLTIRTESLDPVTIRIISICGSEQMVESTDVQPGNIELNIEDLPSGLYIVQLLTHLASSQQILSIQH